jgi:hypothetical protein
VAIIREQPFKETDMRMLGRVVVSLTLFTFLSGTASVAKDKKGTSGEEIKVEGNLPLKDMQVNQMFLQRSGEKTYLYLHRPAEDVYALVDVTDPSKPVLVNANALQGSAEGGSASGSPVAITATTEKKPGQTAVELPTQTINFMDTSDPKAPKTVKTFKGVTAVYSEDARKLVYVVNDEGLWIVRHRSPVPVCPSCPALPPG